MAQSGPGVSGSGGDLGPDAAQPRLQARAGGLGGVVTGGVEDCGCGGAVACKARTKGDVAEDGGGKGVILGLLGQRSGGGQEGLSHGRLGEVEERQAAREERRLGGGPGKLPAYSPGG